MNSFPLERYRYYYAGNKVIATSTYGGKTVRGVAICHPGDSYSVETGKRLAAARCNEKVAIKRMKRAQERFNVVKELYNEISKELDRMSDYKNDAFIAMNEASQAVDNLLAEITRK